MSKIIIKALQQSVFKPKKKWWGFKKDGLQYLCRYNHIMCVFDKSKPIYLYQETKTDKIGISFAIKYMYNEYSKVYDG